MRAGPSQDEVRRHNLGTLLRYVHVHGATSRAELTSRLGLNRSTIGALTAELIGAGLVTEAAPRETGRAGRPSLVVRPESARVYAYALSIEVDRLRAARVGLGGRILERRETERPPGMQRGRRGPSRWPGFVRDDAQPACPAGARYVGQRPRGGRHGPPGGRHGPAGADHRLGRGAGGRGAAGRTRRRGPADGRQSRRRLRARRTRRGAAVGCDNVIYLYGDVGVGAGIVAGGRRVTGHGGYGGEVGHMVVNPYGRPCNCGSRGCWETEIGEHALLAPVRSRRPQRPGRGARSGGRGGAR